jgi:hypothetical protein
MPHGLVIGQQGVLTCPICLVENDLQIDTRHVRIKPDAAKSGTKWPFSKAISSICSQVYAVPDGPLPRVVGRGPPRGSTARDTRTRARRVDTFSLLAMLMTTG